ncbi:DNA oxidative demethylase AlkB [Chitiniphilus eburneus]|uniref:DNA oxidative demethylase AlkB n=1 Tax=Chitiniphilus eburneus TaxID=2571148 RepID=A0A4U0PWW8_9NEIS|nr:DNA oxidative demethylase AlkB [Chitiniphilus eburneus]TJZ73017.1 DNA oxidative demethylase AlkB [Chitiniphilus eburneus]
MNLDLFDQPDEQPDWAEPLAPGAMVLRGLALATQHEILAALAPLIARAPFRHLVTPGGHRMSVAMSNCGHLGWVSDARGYRYSGIDPDSGLPWPAIPAPWLALALDAARRAGFPDFDPQACLINRYQPGARLTLHQDRNEHQLTQPIVSVSLGLPAVFLFGGDRREDKTQRIPLAHGDVVVWGGPARMRYHGVLPVKPGVHPLLGECRVNLTFRQVT